MRQAVGGGQGELERGFVGDAGAVEVGRRDALLGGQRSDLRGGAVDEHDADVQRAQHGDVHQDVGEVLVRDDRAVHVDDERLLAELRDVLQDAPQVGQFHVSVRMFSTATCSGLAKAARLERFQAPLVFLGRADGDADPLGQLVAAHRPDDHAQLLHFVEHPLAVADAHEDEVGRGRDELQAQLAERARVELEAARVDPAGLLRVGGVVQRRQRAGLGDGVDVEGLADLLELGDQVGVADAVAEAQARPGRRSWRRSASGAGWASGRCESRAAGRAARPGTRCRPRPGRPGRSRARR